MSSSLDEKSYAVQVAVFAVDDVTAPKELDAHIIEVDNYNDISLAVFQEIFYPDGENFSVNTNVDNPELTDFSGSTVNNYPLSMPKIVLDLYRQDLELRTLDCMDPCSRTEIINQISQIKSLKIDECGVAVNVQCSLTLQDVIKCLIEQFPKYNKVVWTDRPNHKFVISIRFTNVNTDVKDIIFNFNYSVIIDATSGTVFTNIVEKLTDIHNANRTLSI